MGLGLVLVLGVARVESVLAGAVAEIGAHITAVCVVWLLVLYTELAHMRGTVQTDRRRALSHAGG